MINFKKSYCYRITHIDNLPLLLENGIINNNHPNANTKYIEIGNREIIDDRHKTPVKIYNYGMIGEYVPFYFTPKSIMLLNIITGYKMPVVPKRAKNEILVVRCEIQKLATLSQWFFTDGQANDMVSNHFNNLKYLTKIDWKSIQNSNFSKDNGDFDRPRRYQAEFLVHNQVPLSYFESLNVYDKNSQKLVSKKLLQNNINLAINVKPEYFF